MARMKPVVERKITSLDPKEMPTDSASAIYKDKAGQDRIAAVTEGGANLSSMMAQYQADEAARLAKEAADAVEN